MQAKETLNKYLPNKDLRHLLPSFLFFLRAAI